MDFLKAQLDRIQQQIAGLNATQKMLTAALVAIMVITIVWWGKYASEAEMVPLLNQSLSAADLDHMQQILQDRDIQSEKSGDKLLVHSDKRLAAMSALTFARALPKISDDGLKDMLSQMNPFDPIDKSNKLWNEYKRGFLSKVIAGMNGVAKADVFIDPTRSRGIGGDDVQPTASINIQLEENAKESRKLVDAAAALLLGSQAGLTPNHIAVIVNGVSQHVHDSQSDETADGSEQLERIEKAEKYEESKIRDTYKHIPRMAVTVSVTINITDTHTDETKINSKDVIQKTTKTIEETDETSSPVGQAGGEAGAVPNLGLQSVTGASPASSATQNHTKTEQDFQNIVPQTRTVSHTPGGTTTVTGAALQVPYSYFVMDYKSKNPKGKEPADTDLQPLITSELASMQKTVQNLCMLPSPDKVAVAVYPDIADEANVQPAAMTSTSGAMSGLLSGHAKEISLGALAIMSLFMATMMVRKGTPAVVPAAAASNSPAAPALLSTEPIAGEAAGGNGMLDGMELNEDTIKAQQMVEQVSTMVRENPDAAAGLVKRWLNK